MSERPPGMYLVTEVAELLTGRKYDGGSTERLIREGRLTVEKHGLRRYIRSEEVERILLEQAGVRSASDAHDKVIRLQARNDQLEAEVAELRRTAEPAERQAKRMSAEDALYELSLADSLAILSRVDTAALPWDDGTKIWEAKREIQRQLDQVVQPAFVGKRPKGVPKHAQRRTISTGIGEVDIWYWTTRGHRYKAGFGGPRGEWPGSRGPDFETFGEAVKHAGLRARYEYGKPNRKSSARIRFDVLKRDGFACHYCGRKPPEVQLHVDHVVPVAKVGSNDPENLVAACRDCNLGKSARQLAAE